MVIGALLLWGLFRGNFWTYWAIPVSVSLWIVQYWMERIFFESSRANSGFALLFTVLLFSLTLISAFNRKTKKFLIRSEEHEQPDPYSDTA